MKERRGELCEGKRGEICEGKKERNMWGGEREIYVKERRGEITEKYENE